MMGKTKLAEVKAQLNALSTGKPPKSKVAKGEAKRVVETLEALCADLENVDKKTAKPKRRPAKH